MEVNRDLLISLGGYEVLKQARSMLERGAVLNSDWSAPLLKGLVRDGSISYRAGLILKSARDVENLCTCHASRHRGVFCAHSVAVGLHHLQGQAVAAPVAAPVQARTPAPPPTPTRRIQRVPEGGQSAELSIIFPPNFEPSLARGKTTLYFEGVWGKNRAPLGALPLDTPFSFSTEDVAILDALEALGGGHTPSMLTLEGRQLAELLPRLIGHPRVTLGKSRSLAISATPWRLALSARLEPSGEIVIQRANDPTASCLIEGPTSWVFHDLTFEPLGLPPGLMGLLRAPMKLTRREVPVFLSQSWPALQQQGEITCNFKIEDFSFELLAPAFTLELAGGLTRLEGVLRCGYGSQKLVPGESSEEVWIPDPQNLTRYSARNVAAEEAARQRLHRAGFSGPNAQGRLLLSGQNEVLRFLARDYPGLQKEWQVTLEARLDRNVKEQVEVIQPRFEVTSSGEQWFDLNITFQAGGGERFSPAEIQQLLLKGQGATRLKNGRLGVLDAEAVEELQEVLTDCAPQQHEKGYRLSKVQLGFLDETIGQQPGWKKPEAAFWRERAVLPTSEVPPLGALESILRPYQKTGVGWLHFLRANSFGGVLADEMGLGKTLQVLALLDALKRDSRLGGPCLVVCPTSLLFNWAAEAEKFTPALRVLVLHGARRHDLFEDASRADLVVTSYGLVRRDAERYRALSWDTVILDEAQHIKNRQSQNARAVKAARAEHRLVLTGTPMENSVLDLWSIFDFLMPGYLGSARDFKERYEGPIARDKDAKVQARLARRLRPFLLRRQKKEVARDLPAKIEQVSYCELSDDQRAIYQQVLEASRREITAAVGAQGLAPSRMLILTALLRLRQICCDLRLLKPGERKMASGKLELFAELLDEVLDGGHRVLVFSQFVSMLALLRERLTAEGTAFSYLDGSTVNRGQVVQEFQQNDRIPVFLISLKAGGVGLNLTGADTVIHFDPWWNPAVEDQATDRAHRLGQTRVVTSYKLITRGTVEEKIVNLQARKKGVIRNVLAGEEPLVEALDWSEIQELFAEDGD